jgi:hypothetical protein
MTLLKSLPARPSQESLRKQAKKLARELSAGNAAAIARAGSRKRHPRKRPRAPETAASGLPRFALLAQRGGPRPPARHDRIRNGCL